MTIYILNEYSAGSVGAYSTWEKAYEALNQLEEETRKLDGCEDFRYDYDLYNITEVELDGETVMVN